MTGGSDPAVRVICQVTIPGLKQEAGESSGHLVPGPPVQDTQGSSGVCPGGGGSVAGPRQSRPFLLSLKHQRSEECLLAEPWGSWTLNSCGEECTLNTTWAERLFRFEF